MSVAWNQRRRNAAIMAAVGAAVGASLSSSALAATSYYWSDFPNDHKWDTSSPTFGSNWAPSPGTIGTATTMRGNAAGDFPNSLNTDAFFLAGNVGTNVDLHGATFTVNKLQFGTDSAGDPNFSGDTYKIGTGTAANVGTINFNQIVSGAGVAPPDPQVTGSGINTINSRLVPTANGAVAPTVVVNGGILTFNNSANDLTGTLVTVNAGGTFAPTGGSDTVHESSFGASIHLNGGTFKAIAAGAGTQTGQLTDYIFTNKDSVNASANAGLAPGGINSLVAFAGGRGYDAIRAANQGMTYDLARNGVTGNDGVNGNTGPYSTATLGAQFKGGSQANISTLTLGQMTVSTAATYTFGSRSDDGSVVYIDLNKNGSFESGELIVNNNFDQGYTNRTGNATLAIGTYNIALGWYQGTCCDNNGVEFRVGPTAGLGFNAATMSVINPASPISGLAFSTTSGLLAGYNNTDLTIDNDSTVDISQGGSTNIRSLVLGSGKNITVNGLGTLSVSPTSGSAMAGGGTNTVIANSNVQLNGVLSGPTLLKKQGGGKLILNAASPAFTGNFQVDAGTLTVQANGALGSAAAGQTVLVNSGGQLQFSMPSGTTYSTNQAVTINGVGPGTTGALSGNQNNTFNGKVTLGSDSYITSTANTLTLGGGIDKTATGFALRIGGGATTTVTGQPISGGGSLRKTEGGTLNMNVTNTYTGATTMDGGTINANSASSFGPTTGNAGLIQINAGTVNARANDSLLGKTINVVGGGTLAVTNGNVNANAGPISLGVNNIIASTILFNTGAGTTGSLTNNATPVTIPVDNNSLIRAQSGTGDMSNTTINAVPRIINLSFSGGLDRVFFKAPANVNNSSPDIDANGINTVTTATPAAPGYTQTIAYPLTYDTARIANTGVDGNNGQYSTAAPRFTTPNPDRSNSAQANIEIGITGTVHVGKDGTYTFGTRSDDGSTLFVDLNNNGSFDASEMIVSNNVFQGYTNRIGTATLSATNAGPGGAGNYKIGVGFYQGGCCTNNGLEVRYGVGNITDYNLLSVVDPSNPVNTGGARIQTDAGATLIVGSTVGKPDGFFSGKLQYSAKAAPTAHTLGGVNVQSQTAVIDTLANNNVTADVLNVVNAANLTKTGPGTFAVTTPVTLRGGKITASGGTTDLSSGVLTAAPVVAGLIETQLSGSFNTAAFTPSNTLRSGPLKGNETSPANFPDNTTFAYTGRVYVPDNGPSNTDGQGVIAFAENFDDNVLVKIDGVTRLNDTSWNTPTGTGALSLAVGYHDFEVRFGEGGGGVGPNGGAPASTHWGDSPLIGFGIDLTNPVDNTTSNPDRNNYVFPDNGLASDAVYGPLLGGNPLFAQFGGGTIQVDQGGTLLVGGTAGQLDGTLNGGVLQYTNAATAANDQLGNLTVSALATGAAPATINVGTNHAVTVLSANLLGTLSKAGPGAMTITTANVLANQTGGLDVQASSALTVTTLNDSGMLNNTGAGNLTVNTLNLNTNATFSKAGSGTTTLGTVGVATAQAGTLNVQTGSTLAATTLNVSGTLNNNGDGVLNGGTLNLNNGTFNKTGGTNATTFTNTNVAPGQTGGLAAAAGSTVNATNVTVGGTLNTSGAGAINVTGSIGGAGTLNNTAGTVGTPGTGLAIGGTQTWTSGATFNNNGGTAALNTNAGTPFNTSTLAPAVANLSVNVTDGQVLLNASQDLKGLSVSGPGGLDLNNHQTRIYSSDLNATEAAVDAAVKSANTRNAQTTNGIYDNSRLSYGPSGLGTVAGIAVSRVPEVNAVNQNGPATNVKVRLTWSGDANGDGVKNSRDLQRLTPNYNVITTGATWDQGDFNYDGAVNSRDLQLLTAGYNTGQVFPGGTTAVTAASATKALLSASGSGGSGSGSTTSASSGSSPVSLTGGSTTSVLAQGNLNDARPDIIYDASTGNLKITTAGLTDLNGLFIFSNGSKFDGFANATLPPGGVQTKSSSELSAGPYEPPLATGTTFDLGNVYRPGLTFDEVAGTTNVPPGSASGDLDPEFTQRSGGTGFFDLVYVPEPGSVGLLGIATVGLLARRKRRIGAKA